MSDFFRMLGFNNVLVKRFSTAWSIRRATEIVDQPIRWVYAYMAITI